MFRTILICVLLCLAGVANAQKNKTVVAIYKSCAVYAAATDYEFEDTQNKEAIMVRVSSLPENKAINPKVPKNLVKALPTDEGLPSANARWVGKPFKLTYNAEGEVIKVQAVR